MKERNGAIVAIFDLELARCLVQQGRFSMSADSHRRRGGNPQLEVTVGKMVQWRIFNIDEGTPQTIPGSGRIDGIDIYFLVVDKDSARALLRQFPVAPAHPDRTLLMRLADPRGTERVGGKKIRPIYQIASVGGIERVSIHHSSKSPEFDATANDVTLHVEYELTPVKGYGAEMIELHIGVRGDYIVAPCAGRGSNEAVLEMSPAVYSTVIDEVMRSL